MSTQGWLLSVWLVGLAWGAAGVEPAFAQTASPQQLQGASAIVPQGVRQTSALPPRPDRPPAPPVKRDLVVVSPDTMLLDQGAVTMKQAASGAITITTTNGQQASRGPRVSRSVTPRETQ